jgi:hypothetical protein
MSELKQVDWRKDAKLTDFGPDDEELAQTPQDVIDVLGFDPKELFSEPHPAASTNGQRFYRARAVELRQPGATDPFTA